LRVWRLWVFPLGIGDAGVGRTLDAITHWQWNVRRGWEGLGVLSMDAPWLMVLICRFLMVV
jgi:hypothetical protein